MPTIHPPVIHPILISHSHTSPFPIFPHRSHIPSGWPSSILNPPMQLPIYLRSHPFQFYSILPIPILLPFPIRSSSASKNIFGGGCRTTNNHHRQNLFHRSRQWQPAEADSPSLPLQRSSQSPSSFLSFTVMCLGGAILLLHFHSPIGRLHNHLLPLKRTKKGSEFRISFPTFSLIWPPLHFLP